MIVHPIKDLGNGPVVNLLRQGLETMPEHDLAVNYHPYFDNDPANLFYLLNNGRFDIGNYYVMQTELGEYAGSAGWSRLNDTTALALVRAYIPLKFRTAYNMAKYILPKIMEETVAFNSIWITCNHYNKPIYDALVKLSKGEPAGLFNQWPAEYKKFTPIGTKVVNNSVQFVAEYKREQQ